MGDRFVRKLRNGARLTPEDETLLLGLLHSQRRIDARRDILVEGTAPRALTLILDGWACGYRLLENGKRQIVALYLPGDLCGPFGALPRRQDHMLASLNQVRFAALPLAALREVSQGSPRIAEALWWDLLMVAGIGRERIVSLGRRTAAERLGHLLCELHLRLQLVGLADDKGCEFPLTQADIADALGLTPVHVNRSLQDLRSSGLISLSGRRLTLHDLDALRCAALFDPAYLHLGGVERDPNHRRSEMPMSPSLRISTDGR